MKSKLMAPPSIAVIMGTHEPEEEMHDMCNVIIPDQKSISDLKDGDEFEGLVKGKIMDKDGTKMIMVESVDGDEVQEAEDFEMEAEMSDEEASKQADQSGKDLRSKLAEMNKGKSSMYD